MLATSKTKKKRSPLSFFRISDISPFTSKDGTSSKNALNNKARKWLNFNFGIVLAVTICGGPILTGFAGFERAWQALFVSLIMFFLCLTKWLVKRKLCPAKQCVPSPKIFQIIFLFQCLFVSLTFPSFFFAIAGVVDRNNLSLNDKYFVKTDMVLLGNSIFPKGQFSLWVDQNPVLNPSTALGKLIVDILQAAYVSYYFWGYLLMIWLMWKSIAGWWSDDQKLTHDSITNLKVFMCAWFGSYLLTWLGNLLLPGVSPRIYLKDYYTHSQNGFGLSYQVTKSIEQFRTFATFPSGHVGETVVVAWASLRISRTYGKVVTFFAVLVAIATLWCRYHYLIDVICTIPVILLSLTFAMVLPSSLYKSLFQEPTTDIPLKTVKINV